MKIYDVFMFYNELEMLNLRLHELDEVVHKFVLIEADKTFTGIHKPYYFEENKHLFEKFLPKIIHLKIQDTSTNHKCAWDREAFQKGYASQFLRDTVSDDDLIGFYDCDEIPNSNIYKRINLPLNNIIRMEMDMYLYNFNNMVEKKWLHPCLLQKKHLENHTLYDLRNAYSDHREEFRNPKNFDVINDGGWHLSYFMSPEKIALKIKSFSHEEINTPENTDLIQIQKKMQSQNRVNNHSSLPKYWKLLPSYHHPVSTPSEGPVFQSRQIKGRFGKRL